MRLLRPGGLVAAPPAPTEARYELALVPESPVHRTPPLSLPDVLAALSVQHALHCRLAPFFVFGAGEDAARGLWCPVCGRISWNPGDVRNWYCGFCHRFFRG